MAVELTGVRKLYPNGTPAVAGVDLTIGDGEFFTLLGPSGCGKTTTLRMMAGLEAVTAGRIVLDGRDVTDVHPGQRDVALVFQNYALYPHLSVRQNLTLSLRVRRHTAAEIEARLREVAEMLRLQELLDRRPGQLSGGQRQRVALGRALIRRPNLFLMDEPLSNLDLKLREHMRTEIKALHQRLKITTVYVTHDQAEALILSDRVGVMRDGSLMQVGTPQQLYDMPANLFVARFIGSPSINLLPVAADVRGQEVAFRWAGTDRLLPLPAIGAEPCLAHHLASGRHDLALGVRAELVSLHSGGDHGRDDAVVHLVEPMGSFTLVAIAPTGVANASIDDQPVFAMVPPHRFNVAPGLPVRLDIHPGRLVLFDRTREDAIAHLRDDGLWLAAPSLDRDAEVTRAAEPSML